MKHDALRDEETRTRLTARSGLPNGFFIPVAARKESAIHQFVGDIEEVLSSGTPRHALLVRARSPPKVDSELPIWQLESSAVLRAPLEVWVHVDNPAYRRAYIQAFPDADLAGRVLDHVRNRRVARVKGFEYLRIIPISRGANSSSGRNTESRYELEYQKTPEMMALNKARQAPIDYADLADIAKMLDLKTGGTLQDGVNRAQDLVRPRP